MATASPDYTVSTAGVALPALRKVNTNAGDGLTTPRHHGGEVLLSTTLAMARTLQLARYVAHHRHQDFSAAL